jgi:uncharacterized repeat protein (TIGR01451 family)
MGATSATAPKEVKPTAAHDRRDVEEAYGQLPMSFVPNVGQADPAVRYLARGKGYGLFLTDEAAVLRVVRPEGGRDGRTRAANVQMRWLGGTRAPRLVAVDKLPGKANYLIGNDPESWHTNVPTFARVRYESVYDEIDLVFYGREGEVEYDFVVGAGADPSRIRFRIEGADDMRLDDDGNLVLRAAGGELVQRAPVIYQERDGARVPVSGSYAIGAAGEVSFDVGAYDRAAPLVIDPVLSYTAVFGGEVAASNGWGPYAYPGEIAVDAAGAVYLTGMTSASDFTGISETSLESDLISSSPFLTKINPAGTALEFSTYIGGIGNSNGDIAVDAAGAVYFACSTYGAFPGTATSPIQQAKAGGNDCAVAKIDATGSAILWATYLGGTGEEYTARIALDPSGNVVVAGETSSQDLPGISASSAQPYLSYQEAFVSKIAGDGSALLFSTFYGGWSSERVYDLAVDGAGNAYIAGETQSTSLPGTAESPIQPVFGGFDDGYVAEISADGTSFVYATYLGGDYQDKVMGIALDPAGSLYAVGDTQSPDFPVTGGAFQSSNPGWMAGFVSVIAPGGTSLGYSSYFGGSAQTSVSDVAVLTAGTVHLVGATSSSDLPGAAGSQIQSTLVGDSDAFVTRLDLANPSTIFTTYYGGTSRDYGNQIAVDPAGNMYIDGQTYSADLPGAAGSQIQSTLAGESDAFVAKIPAAGTSIAYATYLGGETAVSAWDFGWGIDVDSSGAAYVTGTTESVDFPVTPGVLSDYFNYYHEGFVTKLNPEGTAIVYSTFIGGSDVQPRAIAVTSAGHAVITGLTSGTDLPGAYASPIQSTNRGSIDAFVMKLNADGSGVVYGTYLGSSWSDYGQAVAVDAGGNAYVTGQTSGPDFRTNGGTAIQPAKAGDSDAFAAKINANGTVLVYSTYLGGSGGEYGYGIAADAAGNTFVTGNTSSANLPGASGSAIQPARSGTSDAFLVKINAAGTARLYSTYLGGSSGESGRDVATDAAGAAYVVGNTGSTNFPVTGGAYQPAIGGSVDGFVTKVAADGSSLVYSTYVGGSGDDYLHGIGVDSDGSASVAGEARSAVFPLVDPVQGTFGGGFSDVVVAKLSPSGGAIEWSTFLGGDNADLAYGVAVDASGSVYVAGYTEYGDFPISSPLQDEVLGVTDIFAAKYSDSADVSVAIAEGADPVPTNGPLTYTITVSNAGPDAASGVTLTNPTPAGTTFAAASASQGTVSAPPAGSTGVVSCALGRVEPGASATVTLTVDVTAPPGAIVVETAAVSTVDVDANGANNATTEPTAVVTDCTISCSADLVVGTGAGAPSCGTAVNYPTPSTTGGCGAVVCAPASGSVFPVGTTTVTCSTGAGPSCSFTVTVVDDTAPAIACPANRAVTTASASGAAVVYPSPTATDNCSTPAVACVPASGSVFPLGTTTVTCTATDSAGNGSSCGFTVTVTLELVANGGFESGVASWTQSVTTIVNNTGEPPYQGGWKAKLRGLGANGTAFLYQSPAFAAPATARTLRFYMRITTSESPTKARDYLYVRVTNASNSTLTTLATFSNVHQSTYGSYALVTVTIPSQYAVAGNRLRFEATENNTAATAFFVDDVSIR